MRYTAAAPWDGWDLPGYALPSGGSLLLALLVVAYAFNGKGSRSASNEELNRGIERAVSGAVRTVGRYVGGRDLTGEPRSTATWWRSGVPADDEGASVQDVAAVPRPRAPAPPVKTRLASGPAAPLRLLGGTVASMGRALAVWSRWPRAARAFVRLAPLPLVWGLWRHPGETRLVVAGAAVAVLVAAFTGPGGLALWRPRPPNDDDILGPAVWAAARQVFRLDEKEPRATWLRIDPDLSADGSRIVLRLPLKWLGSKDAVTALQHVIDTRVPGEWVAQWERSGSRPHAQWTRKPPPAMKPELPDYVAWKPTGDRFKVFLGQAVEGDRIVDVYVHTQSATPHWGVGGNTGSGKSTVLYIPVVHARQHGELIDILDTKQNSLAEADGASGIRIHKTVRSCVCAFAEFMVSMMAAETANGKSGNPGLRAQLVSRTLVVDELPTLIKLAYVWWRYGIKGKGAPPFLEWFAIILLQGRSSNHRIVVGTQQFANTYFGGTMERSQIGTKILVGTQDRISWGVAFGQSTPVIPYDGMVKGRGAFADMVQEPGTDHLYVREFQPAYITPDVARLLAACPPAPAWFDSGQAAPWITEADIKEADLVAGVGAFLPGGKYSTTAAVTQGTAVGGSVPPGRSGSVTGPAAASNVTGGVTTAGTPADTSEDDALPRVYSLAEACEEGVLPWKHSTARQYKRRSEERGIPFPEGVPDGRTTCYTRAELEDWAERWKTAMKRTSGE
ncbi:hypothetical protein [Streptomyces sp. NPDC088557]|uniref:hypothetical protein n=1 Tax=Streptomyces sp. NPDC088557 TaxID=3365867 RepID=UPI0038020C0A